MKITRLLLAWSILSCCTATAQEGTPPKQNAQLPENSMLQRFVGTWNTKSWATTDEGLAPDAYTGTMKARMLGTTWLVNEYEAKIGGQQFSALQRLGFDAKKEKYVGTWADSWVTYQWPLEGMAEENRLVVNSRGPHPTKPDETAQYRDIYEFESDDLMKTKSQLQDDDGKWSTFMTGEFERVTSSKKQTPKTHMLPFLMFIGKAEEAMTFYTELFDDASIISVEKYGPNETGKEGTIKMARFEVAGQRVMCIDSPPVHDFTFTPSFSFFVECESEAQINELFKKLSKGGKVMMPLNNYGFSERFGWTSDEYGVSWQLNLKGE